MTIWNTLIFDIWGTDGLPPQISQVFSNLEIQRPEGGIKASYHQQRQYRTIRAADGSDRPQPPRAFHQTRHTPSTDPVKAPPWMRYLPDVRSGWEPVQYRGSKFSVFVLQKQSACFSPFGGEATWLLPPPGTSSILHRGGRAAHLPPQTFFALRTTKDPAFAGSCVVW